MRFGVMFAALLLAIVGLATPFGALVAETTAWRSGSSVASSRSASLGRSIRTR